MKVLVTGACGYIGKVLCSMLIEQGHRVFACDNDLHASDPPNVIRRYRCSFDDDYIIREMQIYNIDVVVHLAATSTIGPDATDPLLYHYNNTARTIAFLHKLKKFNWDGQIVFASTAAVYDYYDRPVHEADRLIPSSLYGRTKQECEKIFQHWDNKTIFRFFNVAGAYNGFGEEQGDTHLLSKICHSIINDQELIVFGNDYPTRDNTCVRDYVHVADVCSAIILAAEEEVQGTYNLGTERGLTVKEMIDQFEMHTGQRVFWKFGARREGDQPYLVANPNWFIRKTGFQYKYTIRDIINSSWEHYGH
jgi:UDP-glucose 4-epimerase